MHRTLLFVVLAACTTSAVEEEPAIDLDDGDADGDVDFAVDDNMDEKALAAPATVTRLFYGTTVEEQSLIYYRLRPPQPNGRIAFLVFAEHGFEDAWAQDGRALYSIAHKMIDYYGAHPDKLAGWTVYVVPSANPDGMRYGINNWRERAGAYGRCTSAGKDINRNVSLGTSREQRALKTLFDQLDPTIVVDFHGWYNTYYGNAKVGGFFQRSFNATYAGKPTKYCYVASTGKMDCGATLGGKFHGTTSISSDLFVHWVLNARNTPAALIEYPAPDFNNNGAYDTVFDADLGYRRMGKITLDKIWNRTRVALDDLYANY